MGELSGCNSIYISRFPETLDLFSKGRAHSYILHRKSSHSALLPSNKEHPLQTLFQLNSLQRSLCNRRHIFCRILFDEKIQRNWRNFWSRQRKKSKQKGSGMKKNIFSSDSPFFNLLQKSLGEDLRSRYIPIHHGFSSIGLGVFNRF